MLPLKLANSEANSFRSDAILHVNIDIVPNLESSYSISTDQEKSDNYNETGRTLHDRVFAEESQIRCITIRFRCEPLETK
ncbi:hypothetical protein T4B_882 [Trichinella pseudospiralis]|uniref:Uncharacterized protein n=1 Tax=Trichinella pseudospiralis TaxID=6337 RepID=A0A0V1EDY7_TRIPS|nr:hypothetical protein T4A_75 [Trichinella pseudospiralis]KRZ26476.1 hypothetical protein T4B_882 [Trichinella pseudospiralis]